VETVWRCPVLRSNRIRPSGPGFAAKYRPSGEAMGE
jgi:hypothetical protein